MCTIIQPSVFRPEATFAYPWPYEPSQDESLVYSDILSRHARIETLRFTPREALLRWNASSAGQWQSNQTARYPSFHRDLDAAIIPEGNNPHEFRQTVLRRMGSVSLYGLGPDSGLDLHPIGHMVRVLSTYDNLVFDGPLSALPIAPRHSDLARHGLALHDTPETEHPGVTVLHGSPVGDIAADIGKTEEDRRKEKAIFKTILDDEFSDVYSASMREDIVRLVSHEVSDDDELAECQATMELAHHLNSLYTGAAMGEAGAHLAEASQFTLHANILTLIAGQSESLLRSKFESLFEHAPRLRSAAGYVTDLSLAQLHASAHNRDEDPVWLAWRQSDNVVSRYGEYAPEKF